MAAKRDRVVDALRSAILAGDLDAGTRLPVEPELARQHGVGVATVRAALAVLVNEGLIHTEHGSGSYVQDRQPIIRDAQQRLSHQARQTDQAAHLAEATQAGKSGTVKTRLFFEFADAATAEQLGIAVGDEVLVRDRVMGLGGQPTQLSTSRYPRNLTKGTPIEHDNPGPGGVLARFEEAGHTLAPHMPEVVELHRATQDEAAALQIPTGSACFRITRTATSDTGRVLEVNVMTLVDRYVLVYAVPTQ